MLFFKLCFFYLFLIIFFYRNDYLIESYKRAELVLFLIKTARMRRLPKIELHFAKELYYKIMILNIFLFEKIIFYDIFQTLIN